MSDIILKIFYSSFQDNIILSTWRLSFFVLLFDLSQQPWYVHQGFCTLMAWNLWSSPSKHPFFQFKLFSWSLFWFRGTGLNSLMAATYSYFMECCFAIALLFLGNFECWIQNSLVKKTLNGLFKKRLTKNYEETFRKLVYNCSSRINKSSNEVTLRKAHFDFAPMPQLILSVILPLATFTRQSSGLGRRVSVPEDTEVFYQEDTPTEGGAFLSHIGTDLSGTNTFRVFNTSNSQVESTVTVLYLLRVPY